MEFQQLIYMLNIFVAMSVDTYMKCKYTLMAAASESEESQYFFDKLFEMAEERRPKLLEMKGGANNVPY